MDDYLKKGFKKSEFPKVTVLMPVYNAEKYLKEAIDSIINQTFKNFEFLIINDGSKDNSRDIILSYSDPRIRLIENDINIGLTKSLNKGIDLSTGTYIARMDSDDVSLPERFAKQVKFMDENPQVAVCGTWIKLFGEASSEVWSVPGENERIKALMLFYSVIYHPTVFMRRDLLKKFNLYYAPFFSTAQDYDFWVRLMEYSKAGNLQEVLLYYRFHSDKIGRTYNSTQIENANKVRLYQIQKLGINFTKEEFKIHEAISYWRFQATKSFVEQADSWLRKLQIANKNTSYYPEPAFSQALAEKWFNICKGSAKLGFWIWEKYWQSPLSQPIVLNLSQKLKFAARCFL